MQTNREKLVEVLNRITELEKYIKMGEEAKRKLTIEKENERKLITQICVGNGNARAIDI